MKLLILTGPSQVGKSWSSRQYCQSRPVARLDGDAIFNEWFKRIGKAEFVYKKGSLEHWRFLIEGPDAELLSRMHRCQITEPSAINILLEGIVYRHSIVRCKSLSTIEPLLEMPYGVIDYRRTPEEFVTRVCGTKPYYSTEKQCSDSYHHHVRSVESPPESHFHKVAMTHQEVVAVANQFFGLSE